ncbi:MAG TPA: hypothetical protein VHM69_20040, partial [Rubrobacter sp.]|nr:hypothetical protein [Rubrobacter sp.]
HFEEIFNHKNLAACDEIMAEDFVEHAVAPFAQSAPGKRFVARQSHWFRVADGKLVEHWATREDLPTMLQLGIIQPPGAPPY